MEQMKQLIEQITEQYKDMGLYLADVDVATTDTEAIEGEGDTDFREKLIAGEAHWIVQASFSIGDVAWSDRVLNPERHKEDIEFKTVMPTEAELYIERLRAAGGDPFKMIEMETPDDEDGSD